MVYMLMHSIYLRKLLAGASIDLDKNEISPSDFAVLVRGLPLDITKDTLKQQLE
jgi:hypothetical protein